MRFRLLECLNGPRSTGACFSDSSIDVETERQLILFSGIDKDDALHQLSLDPAFRGHREKMGLRSHLFGRNLPISNFVQSKVKYGRRRPKTADEPLVLVDVYDMHLASPQGDPAITMRERCECHDGETCIVCCTSIDLMAFPELKDAKRTKIADDEFHVLVPTEVAEELGLIWE